MEDFGAMLDSHMDSLKGGFNPGERVKAVVTSVGKQSVFIEVGARADGVVDANELRDKEGNLTVEPGDTVAAYFVKTQDGGMLFTTRMSGNAVNEHLLAAKEGGLPVEGKVISERKGGFAVKVGSQEAFCPFSQIDMRRGEADDYIGKSFSFVLTEVSDRNLVVSRRKLQEKEAAEKAGELQESLDVGDVVDGEVVRIMPFGAFVNIGGVDGLVPMGELAWGRVEDASEVVSIGDSVRVKVLSIDWNAGKIGLSICKAGGDPWDDVENLVVVGRRVEGTVVKLLPVGAIVQLVPGIDGMVHISKFGTGKRIQHPKEVVSEGEVVEVYVEEIDIDSRRIRLSMEEGAGRTEKVDEKLTIDDLVPGDTYSGTVDGVLDFGVFVKLAPGLSGLLHVSGIDMEDAGANRSRYLSKRFPEGSIVAVVVRDIRDGKVGLALKEKQDKDQADSAARGDTLDKGTSSLGSLGSLFDGLDL